MRLGIKFHPYHYFLVFSKFELFLRGYLLLFFFFLNISRLFSSHQIRVKINFLTNFHFSMSICEIVYEVISFCSSNSNSSSNLHSKFCLFVSVNVKVNHQSSLEIIDINSMSTYMKNSPLTRMWCGWVLNFIYIIIFCFFSKFELILRV